MWNESLWRIYVSRENPVYITWVSSLSKGLLLNVELMLKLIFTCDYERYVWLGCCCRDNCCNDQYVCGSGDGDGLPLTRGSEVWSQSSPILHAEVSLGKILNLKLLLIAVLPLSAPYECVCKWVSGKEMYCVIKTRKARYKYVTVYISVLYNNKTTLLINYQLKYILSDIHNYFCAVNLVSQSLNWFS